MSPDANEICLEVAPENISRALKTAQNAKSVKIKLTKKHCPCLTLAADLVSLSFLFHEILNMAYLSIEISVIRWHFTPSKCAHCCLVFIFSCRKKPSLSSVSRVVTHDIPVDVIPRRLWHDFREPSMPDFDVSGNNFRTVLKAKRMSACYCQHLIMIKSVKKATCL